MPSILKIRVNCARDLPVMDRSSELADAYAEVRFGDLDPQRSGIARKTLNPVWNVDFRFEVADDSMLQNEPLEIRVLDYDAITANDAVGSVLIDLDPLLQLDSGVDDRVAQISGWFPLYDTLRGIRGEIHVQVRLQFFGDANPFKDSSAGVQFFTSTQVPACFSLDAMTGFVDALVVDDDPEYSVYDNFRTPRSSNEARQKLLFRLSGQLRRMLGKKALEMRANAIVGFKQCFDLENHNKSIVGRAIGTACFVTPLARGNAAAVAPASDPHASTFAAASAAAATMELDPNTVREEQESLEITAAETPASMQPQHLLHHHHHSQSATARHSGYTRQRSHSATGLTPNAASALAHRTSASGIDRGLPTAFSDTVDSRPAPGANGATYDTSVSTNGLLGSGLVPTGLSSNGSPAGSLAIATQTATASASATGSGHHVGPHHAPGTVRPSTSATASHDLDSPSTPTLGPLRPLPSPTLGATASGGGPLSPKSSAMNASASAAVARRESRRRGRRRRGDVGWLEQPVQLTTMMGFPGHSVVRVGGVVGAKSVKLLSGWDEALAHTRDLWWQELREEIKAHAKNLRCSHVLGYRETTSVHDDLVVLSASGTAANLDLEHDSVPCRIAHVPYPRAPTPFPMGFAVCAGCRRRHVPQLLMATIDPPADLPVAGPGTLVEAHVYRAKKRKDGETNAANVSDAIPFAEYDLHKQLLGRMRALGCNALFGLQVQLAMGDEFLVAVATGTAYRLPFLPSFGNAPGDLAGGPAAASGVPPGSGDDDSSDSDDDSVVSGLSGGNAGATAAGGLTAGTAGVGYSTSAAAQGSECNAAILDAEEAMAGIDLTPGLLSPQLYNGAPPTAQVPGGGPLFRHQLVLAVRQVTLGRPAAGYAYGGGPSAGLHGAAAGGAGGASGGLGGGAGAIGTLGGVSTTDAYHHQLAAVLQAMYTQVALRQAFLHPAIIAGITHDISVVSSTQIQVRMAGIVMGRLDVPEDWGIDVAAATRGALSPSADVAAAVTQSGGLASTSGWWGEAAGGGRRQQSSSSWGDPVGGSYGGGTALLSPPPLELPGAAGAMGSTATGLSSAQVQAMEQLIDEEVVFETDENEWAGNGTGVVPRVSNASSHAVRPRSRSRTLDTALPPPLLSPTLAPMSTAGLASQYPGLAELMGGIGGMGSAPPVEITPLATIPHTRPTAYLGRLALHFVKETSEHHAHHHGHYGHHQYGTHPHYTGGPMGSSSLANPLGLAAEPFPTGDDDDHESDGMGAFVQLAWTEILAVVAAHVQAMGGNALVAFRVEHSGFHETIKNQAYALVCVSGDVCLVKPAVSAATAAAVPRTGAAESIFSRESVVMSPNGRD
ncbi:hypothetical protein H9P43_005980 [Blastocladiella emersonii ATCC 22665]|nr:hypothetical protein H9P43_005980 [Blastocladiella emersonii ATCC 22665]